jgi:hypothetical protein
LHLSLAFCSRSLSMDGDGYGKMRVSTTLLEMPSAFSYMPARSNMGASLNLAPSSVFLNR